MFEDFKLKGEGTLDEKPFLSGVEKMKEVGKQFQENFSKNMIGSVATANLLTKAISSMASALKSAVSDFANLDRSISKVNTLMDTSVKSSMQLRTELFEVSKRTGIWAGDLAEASYQALSAGIATEELTGFIEQMGIAAKAGFTDMNTAVTATTQIMNAYGKETYTVQQINDKMLQTQNNGVTTFGELGKSLYNVIPAAAAMGISLDEVLAGIATLTLSGTPTAQATTQMRQAILELSDETKGAGKAFNEITGESFKSFIARGGDMATAMNAMDIGARKNGKSMIQLFSSVEAGQGALSLAKDNAETFAKQIDAIGESAGATERAHKTATDNILDQWTKVQNELRISMTEYISANEALVRDTVQGFGIIANGLFKILDKVSVGVKWYLDNIFQPYADFIAKLVVGSGVKVTPQTQAKFDVLNNQYGIKNKTGAELNPTKIEIQPTVLNPVDSKGEKVTLGPDGIITGKGKKSSKAEMERQKREQEKALLELERDSLFSMYEQKSILESEFNAKQISDDIKFFEERKILKENFLFNGAALEFFEMEYRYQQEAERLTFQEQQLQADLQFYSQSEDYAQEHAETMVAIETNRLAQLELQAQKEENLDKNRLQAKRAINQAIDSSAINALSSLINMNNLSLKEMAKSAKNTIAQALGQEGSKLMVLGTRAILEGMTISANPLTPGAGAPLIAAGQADLASGAKMLAGGIAVGNIGGSTASNSGGHSQSSIDKGKEQAAIIENEKPNKELNIYTDGDVKDMLASFLNVLDEAAKDNYNVNLIEKRS